MDENKLWDLRAFVYQHFAETTYPPLVNDVASHFALSHKEVASAYEELHQRHALFLKPGTHEILMANPFSGVETPFKVHANSKTYFANCAWDTLGIPAVLHLDAEIETACAQSGEPIRLRVTGQQVQNSDVLVHFLLPFREWYNDLVFT
ncbi:MAG TPA: organomercurial lyase [Anaerolineales bacterium]|nr:organomercurial lyase [Anaerolineales bacterium]